MMTTEPMPTEVVAAHIAVSCLCRDMGESFTNAIERTETFDNCVIDLLK